VKAAKDKVPKKPGPVAPKAQFKPPSFSRGVSFGIKRVTASRLELDNAEGLCATTDILEVADSLIAYYTNAEADLTAHMPYAL
jgi:hypothetical protein